MSDEPQAVIHVIDDDESMRSALCRLFAAAGYAVKSYASAGDYLVTEPDDGPGCLLLDLQMPGPSGLEMQQALRRRGCPLPIVFLSAHGDIPSSVRAIKAGASDFLTKPVDHHKLLAAVENALALNPIQPACEPQEAREFASLSERERVVLRGIVAGRLNKQMGADLSLSERTIKSCRAELMRKLGAHSLADLMRRAAPLLRD